MPQEAVKEWPIRRCKRTLSRWDKSKAQNGSSSHSEPSFCPALDLQGALFKILTFLPLLKIFQLRTVCKSWNLLLRSPTFLCAWSSAPHEEWLVMVRKLPEDPPYSRELIAYDPALDCWMPMRPLLGACPTVALSVLGGPSLCCVASPLYSMELRSLWQYASVDGIYHPAWQFMAPHVTAASGAPGLVCCLHSPLKTFISWSSICQRNLVHPDFDTSVYGLLVLNLFTGTHHMLPPPPKHSDDLSSWLENYYPLLVSMQPLSGDGYRVFLQLKFISYPGPVEVYDSHLRCWKVGRSCRGPSEAKIASAADLDNADLVQFLDETGIVFAYNVELDEWSQVLAKPPCEEVFSDVDNDTDRNIYVKTRRTLFRYRGQVFLAVVRSDWSSFRGFEVWELRMHESSPPITAGPGTPIADWVKVASTPRHYWLGFYSSNGDGIELEVNFISSGRLVCMTAVGFSSMYIEGRYYPPLVYDLGHQSWFHLPLNKEANDLIGCFALQPSFISTN